MSNDSTPTQINIRNRLTVPIYSGKPRLQQHGSILYDSFRKQMCYSNGKQWNSMLAIDSDNVIDALDSNIINVGSITGSPGATLTISNPGGSGVDLCDVVRIKGQSGSCIVLQDIDSVTGCSGTPLIIKGASGQDISIGESGATIDFKGSNILNAIVSVPIATPDNYNPSDIVYNLTLQEWFKIAGGSTSNDQPYSIKTGIVNQLGEIFVAGRIDSTNALDFNGTPIVGYGLWDAFVAKLSPNGTQQWFKVAGGTNIDYAYSLTDDGEGGVYVTGAFNYSFGVSFYNPVDFNGDPFPGYGGLDIYVARLDASGTQTWIKPAGGLNADSGFYITSIKSSNSAIYVTGVITGGFDFDGNAVPAYGGFDIFIAKLTDAGTQEWFKVAGGTGYDNDVGVNSIVIGGNQEVYITGNITTTVGNNPVDFSGNAVIGYGNSDIFLAKLSEVGTQEWFILAGSTGNDFSSSVSALNVNGSGEIFVAGTINTAASPLDFLGNPIVGNGGIDIIVAKILPNGTQDWIKLAGGAGTEYTPSISQVLINNLNEIYIGGIIEGGISGGTVKDFAGTTVTAIGSGNIMVAKLKSDGTQDWFRLGGASSNVVSTYISSVDINGVGAVYVAGGINSTSIQDFDGNFITGYGNTDSYVAKLTSDGSQVWFKVSGSTAIDQSYGVSSINIGGNGEVYITGTIQTDLANNPRDFNGNIVTGYGGYDIYVAKLSDTVTPIGIAKDATVAGITQTIMLGKVPSVLISGLIPNKLYYVTQTIPPTLTTVNTGQRIGLSDNNGELIVYGAGFFSF